LAWCVAQVDASRIDAWNIYQASRQAMNDAAAGLSVQPDFLLVDALKLDLMIEQKPLIKGDGRSVSIAAASILAKVARDLLMRQCALEYPQYGLAANKGYATALHLAALREHGPSPMHRYSFAPVREACCWAASATQEPLPLSAPEVSPLPAAIPN
jgi:ribonuclease HII